MCLNSLSDKLFYHLKCSFTVKASIWCRKKGSNVDKLRDSWSTILWLLMLCLIKDIIRSIKIWTEWKNYNFFKYLIFRIYIPHSTFHIPRVTVDVSLILYSHVPYLTSYRIPCSIFYIPHFISYISDLVSHVSYSISYIPHPMSHYSYAILYISHPIFHGITHVLHLISRPVFHIPRLTELDPIFRIPHYIFYILYFTFLVPNFVSYIPYAIVYFIFYI